MKRELIECDICRAKVDPSTCNWETKPTHFKLTFPRDGVNGGVWSMDVCASCRVRLYDIIDFGIRNLRAGASRA